MYRFLISFNISLHRFIYGEDKNFGKASLAIEVYRFAVEMQLKALMAAVVWHFENLEPILCCPLMNSSEMSSMMLIRLKKHAW
jgi:hypothetical protein